MTQRRIDLALDDEHPPVAGDILVKGVNVHRVTESRLMDSPVWPNRWMVTTQLIRRRTPDEIRRDCVIPPPLPAEGGRVVHVEPYRHGEGPAEFFGPPE